MSFPTRIHRRRTTTGAIAFACLASLLLSAVPAAAEPGELRWSPKGVPAGKAVQTPPQKGSPTPAGIADLDKALDQAELAAAKAADELFQAAGQSMSVQIAIDDAANRADLAREELTDRVRRLYMTGKPDPMTRLALGMRESKGFASVATAGVASDQSLINAVERQSRNLDRLRHRAVQEETALEVKAKAVATLQDRALALLTAAQVRYANDQVRLAALEARKKEIEAKAQAVRAAVKPKAAVLAGITPAVTARGQRAASAEAPIIAVLEAAGAGFPPGYKATGRILEGKASWYGPGFYGKPTATGAPYDAERFTCAMLAVPLGTVVRVTTDDGKAINVLVNDRGPYINGRIIDMSAVGARMLGYSGVKAVRVEVLEPAQ